MLIVAERMKNGLINMKIKESIEKVDGGLTSVIEDFMRAVDVEALDTVKKSGTRSSPEFDDYAC